MTVKGPAKRPETNKPVEAPSVEPTGEGHYELSPLMTKMVDAELHDVMMKILEILPDNPDDDAEKIVAKRFRNKTGDALRNTIGLNVTKRLLNVHNSLYVKLQFGGSPQRPDLVSFLNKNRISACKRVAGSTFVAKMKNFQDFDLLCENKALKCGNIRVVATPCYQFLVCPPNLRTCYDGKGDKNKADTKNTSTIQVTTPAKVNAPHARVEPKENQKIAAPKIIIKQEYETDDEKQKPAAKQNVAINSNPPAAIKNVTAKTSQPSQTTNIAQKASASVENKQGAKAPVKSNNGAANQPKNTPSKPNTEKQNATAAKATNISNATPAKANSEKRIPAPKPMQAKATNTQTDNKATTNQNVAPNVTKAAANNENSTKVNANTPAQTTPIKPAVNQKTTENSAPKSTAVNKKPAPNVPKPVNINQNQANKSVKITPKTTPKQTKPVKVPVKKKQENDFDELDDHAILALINEGIVLDECSGSDEE